MPGDDDELSELQRKLRLVVALVLVVGLFLDRVAPVILGPRYDPVSEVGIGAVLAAILVLLGIEGVSWFLKR